jgi:hypothetical protein
MDQGKPLITKKTLKLLSILTALAFNSPQVIATPISSIGCDDRLEQWVLENAVNYNIQGMSLFLWLKMEIPALYSLAIETKKMI